MGVCVAGDIDKGVSICVLGKRTVESELYGRGLSLTDR